MTHLDPTNILCIHITRQRVGQAVFEGGDLELISGNPLPRGNSTRAERARFIRRLGDVLDRYRIGVVVMKRLTVQQRGSLAVARVHRRIQKLAMRRGVTLVIRDRRVEKLGSEIHRTDELGSIYPELRKYVRGGTSWERRYYSHVVKAVLLGVRWMSELNLREGIDEG